VRRQTKPNLLGLRCVSGHAGRFSTVSVYALTRGSERGKRGGAGRAARDLARCATRSCRRAAFRRRSSPLLHRLRWPSCAHTNQQQVHGETVLSMPIRQMRQGSTGWYCCSAPSEAMLHPRSHTVHRQIGGGGNRVSGGMTSSYSYRALQIRTKRKAPISSGAHLNMMRVSRQSQTIHTLTLSRAPLLARPCSFSGLGYRHRRMKGKSNPNPRRGSTGAAAP
jgi:hypothetical protein